MKKISTIILTLASVVAFGQSNSSSQKISFGIKAGVNFAEFRAHDFPAGQNPDLNMKTSMHGGFLLNIPLGKGSFAVQPELLYSGQGSKITSTTVIGTVTTTSMYEQDLSYITLPIMIQWKSMNGLYLETGPQPGILVRGKQDGPGDSKTDNKSSFDDFDLTWGAGIGFISKMGLGLGARYCLGLTNTIEDGGGNNSPNNGPELKNSVVQVGLIWHFGK